MVFNALNSSLINSEAYSLHDGMIDSFQYDITKLSIEIIASTTTDNADHSDMAKILFTHVHYCLINNSTICSTNCRSELNGWGCIDYSSIPDLCVGNLINPPLAVNFEFVDCSRIIVVCDTICFDRI